MINQHDFPGEEPKQKRKRHEKDISVLTQETVDRLKTIGLLVSEDRKTYTYEKDPSVSYPVVRDRISRGFESAKSTYYQRKTPYRSFEDIKSFYLGATRPDPVSAFNYILYMQQNPGMQHQEHTSFGKQRRNICLSPPSESNISPSKKLSQELSIPEHEIIIFLIRSVPDEQRNGICLAEKTPEDVFDAFKFTDEQLIDLAIILGIKENSVEHFAEHLSISLPFSRRLLIDLFRFKIIYDPENKKLFDIRKNQLVSFSPLKMLSYYQNNCWSAAKESISSSGFKSFDTLSNFFNMDSKFSTEQIFPYLFSKISYLLGDSTQFYHHVFAKNKAKFAFLHRDFFDVTDEAIRNAMHSKAYQDIYIKSGNAIGSLIADIFIKSYTNYYWASIILINQVKRNVSNMFEDFQSQLNALDFVRMVHFAPQVPEDLIQAYCADAEKKSAVIDAMKLFKQEINAVTSLPINPKKYSFDYAGVDWPLLFDLERTRLGIAPRAPQQPVLFREPAWQVTTPMIDNTVNHTSVRARQDAPV